MGYVPRPALPYRLPARRSGRADACSPSRPFVRRRASGCPPTPSLPSGRSRSPTSAPSATERFRGPRPAPGAPSARGSRDHVRAITGMKNSLATSFELLTGVLEDLHAPEVSSEYPPSCGVGRRLWLKRYCRLWRWQTAIHGATGRSRISTAVSSICRVRVNQSCRLRSTMSSSAPASAAVWMSSMIWSRVPTNCPGRTRKPFPGCGPSLARSSAAPAGPGVVSSGRQPSARWAMRCTAWNWCCQVAATAAASAWSAVDQRCSTAVPRLTFSVATAAAVRTARGRRPAARFPATARFWCHRLPGPISRPRAMTVLPC